jgi:hypothetical protein
MQTRASTQKALATHYDALKLFEKVGDNYGTAMVLSNLSRVYSALNKNKDAIDYLQKGRGNCCKK